jgi:helix-turn-helix protein
LPAQLAAVSHAKAQHTGRGRIRRMKKHSLPDIAPDNTDAQLQPRGLTIPQAAAYSGFTIWGIRQAIWSRKIEYIQGGKRFIILRDDLDRFLEKQRSKVWP